MYFKSNDFDPIRILSIAKNGQILFLIDNLIFVLSIHRTSIREYAINVQSVENTLLQVICSIVCLAIHLKFYKHLYVIFKILYFHFNFKEKCKRY